MICLSPALVIQCAAQSAGLVAAYGFNEGTGSSTVADASGNGNNGTLSGATWTASGKYGGALVFNGASALVTINDAASLHLTTAMTLEAWVNPSTVDNAWRDVIYKGNDNYYLEGTSPNSSRPAMGGTFGGNLYGTAALTANTWTHLAATYDGTTMRLYVNGAQVTSQPQTGSIATSGNPLQIGGDSIYGQYFAGMIDEVRVYNQALTAAEIQTDMNTPVNNNIPTAPGNLIATAISENEVDLSWTPSFDSNGVTEYLIERSDGAGSSNFIQIGTAKGSTYQDLTVTPRSSYRYRVRAMDAAGNLGPYSNVADVYTGLSVSPHVVTLIPPRTQQFTASLSNVTWSVDDVTGGSASSGTITGQGLYSPPAGPGIHSVAATTSDLTESGTATVYVTTYPGTFTSQ